MKNACAKIARLGAVVAAAAGLRAAGAAPAGPYSTEAAAVGAGGYVFNFVVNWTADDSPAGTTSAAGRVDLVDGGGTIVAQLTAIAAAAGPVATVTGGGTVTGLAQSILLYGAGGTPADARLRGTWTITGVNPGAYALRLWATTASVAGRNATTITTYVLDAGGGGPIGSLAPPPTPTPAPAAPTISLAVPGSATALAAFPIAAAATQPAGGYPLAAVVIEASTDNGATWSRLLANAAPASPADREALTYAFAAPGAGEIRAIATDSHGQTAQATSVVPVGRAAQGGVAIAPATATVTPGQVVTFAASGGATGNYSWSGAAGGSGPAQSVAFPGTGTFTVIVEDAGNGTYTPSFPATATVTVQAPFNVLTVLTTGNGFASGGGSYAPNAQAIAVATPAAGSIFAGWTGDATGPGAAIQVAMTASKTVTAHFTPLLAQAITYVPLAPVSTRSPGATVVAVASSGLPVTLTLDAGPVTLSGNTLVPTGATGEVTITATQPGNGEYLPAPPVLITLVIGLPPPGIMMADDAAATKRTDRTTRNTSFMSGPGR